MSNEGWKIFYGVYATGRLPPTPPAPAPDKKEPEKQLEDLFDARDLGELSFANVYLKGQNKKTK